MGKYFGTLLLFVLMVFLVVGSVSAKARIKVKIEPSGNLTSEYSTLDSSQSWISTTNQDVSTGCSIAGEYLQSTQSGLVIGGGIEYQMSRTAEVDQTGFNFIPLYFLVRTGIVPGPGPRPYLIGEIGYNFYHEAGPTTGYVHNGGLYYGFGGGIAFRQNMELEMLYSCNNGEASSESSNLDIKERYTKLGVALNYRF